MEENIDYLDWVTNEYNLWKSTLDKCMSSDDEFQKFKREPQVLRMVGVSSFEGVYLNLLKDMDLPWAEISNIDNIGSPEHQELVNGYRISTITLRYVYYANKILDILSVEHRKPKIIEIGGGFGGFGVIMNCLSSYRKMEMGRYSIYDLPEVQRFQKFYIDKIVNKTSAYGIPEYDFPDSTRLDELKEMNKYTYCISCYALGEFDKTTKHDYINKIISKVRNGFILWNPHSNIDDIGMGLLLKYHPDLISKKEEPLTSPYNLEITF